VSEPNEIRALLDAHLMRLKRRREMGVRITSWSIGVLLPLVPLVRLGLLPELWIFRTLILIASLFLCASLTWVNIFIDTKRFELDLLYEFLAHGPVPTAKEVEDTLGKLPPQDS